MDINDKIRRAVDKGMACNHQAGWSCSELNCGYNKARRLIAPKLLTLHRDGTTWTRCRVEADIAAALGEVFYRKPPDPAEAARFASAINRHLPRRMRFTAEARRSPGPS